MGWLPQLSDVRLQNHTQFSDDAYAAFLMYDQEVNSPLDMKPPTRLYTDDYLKTMQNERQLAYALVKELVCKEQQVYH